MGDLFFPDARFRKTFSIPFQSGIDETHDFALEDVLKHRGEFDCIINMNWWDSHKIESLSALADVPFISLSKNFGHVPSIGQDQNVVDYAFQMAELIDPEASVEKWSYMMPAPSLASRRAEQIAGLLPRHRRLLAVHTLTRIDKRWTKDKFKSALELFLSKHEDFVALVIDRVDDGLDECASGDRIFSLEGVDLETTVQLLGRCDVFVGIDSFFLHVADFLRKPSVGLFGSTNPNHWGFRFAPHNHVVASRTVDIEVGAVVAAMDEMASLVKRPVYSSL